MAEITCVGMRYREHHEFDKSKSYSLQRDNNNAFDMNAIKVMCQEPREQHVGFICARQARVVAPLVDDGAAVLCFRWIASSHMCEHFLLDLENTKDTYEPVELPGLYRVWSILHEITPGTGKKRPPPEADRDEPRAKKVRAPSEGPSKVKAPQVWRINYPPPSEK